MLHPSESLAHPPQGLNLPEGGREEGRKTESVSIWRWISVRELVFIFAACSVGAALFQTRDNVRCLTTCFTLSCDAIQSIFLSALCRLGVEIWTRLLTALRNTQWKTKDCTLSVFILQNHTNP